MNSSWTKIESNLGHARRLKRPPMPLIKKYSSALFMHLYKKRRSLKRFQFTIFKCPRKERAQFRIGAIAALRGSVVDESFEGSQIDTHSYTAARIPARSVILIIPIVAHVAQKNCQVLQLLH